METNQTQVGQPPQASSNTYTATDGSKLNPTAVLLAKSIRNVESDGNYNAVGDNGQSHGAYQFNKDNFKNWAKQYNLDGNDFSPKNQDRLAYTRINDLLEKGLKPSEVAAIWNGAKSTSTGYQAINPAYVQKVRAEYTKQYGGYQSQSGSELAPGVPSLTLNASDNQPSSQSTSQEPSLDSQLVGRTNDAGQAISNTMSGKINPLSGLIQVGGAVAGAAGDVVNKGLELIPGVKQLEGLIGQGVGSLAKTSAGQSVVKAMQDFSSAHPELSADIGAGFNIATAIPIFKGLGVLKDVAMDGVAQALKSTAEKGMANDWMDMATRSSVKNAPKFFEDNPNIIKDAIDRRIIPTMDGNGQLQTADAVGKSWDTINENNATVKESLNNPKYTNVGENSDAMLNEALNAYPRSEFNPTDILDNAKELTPQNGALWRKFEAGQASMADVNQLRVDLDEATKSFYTSTVQPPIKKDMGVQLANAMRGYVQDNVPETQEAFKEMSTQFKIQKALDFIQGKKPPTGSTGEVMKDVGTAAGEMAGNAFGGPIAGAITGRGIGGYIAKKFGRNALQNAILDRTGSNAVTAGKGALLKGLIKIGGGAAAQTATRNQ